MGTSSINDQFREIPSSIVLIDIKWKRISLDACSFTLTFLFRFMSFWWLVTFWMTFSPLEASIMVSAKWVSAVQASSLKYLKIVLSKECFENMALLQIFIQGKNCAWLSSRLLLVMASHFISPNNCTLMLCSYLT